MSQEDAAVRKRAMNRKPSNEPTRYDPRRVATLQPIKDACEALGLPMLRYRKLHTICNAIEMQIEDGGDSPEVNSHLLDALRAAVVHQVGKSAAEPVLRAIETFRRGEADWWKQVKVGTLPPAPEEQLDDLIAKGYEAFDRDDRRTACDHWLAAWEIVKQLARPDMRDPSAFDVVRPHSSFLSNWCQDLMLELHGVGFKEPRYHERRLEFACEYLEHFPDESVLTQVNFMRAQGEALWELGRQSEAEAAYAALVERFPDEAWSYIGWADHFWLWDDSPKEYARAAAIMERGLARPHLNDRDHLVERLRELHTESGQHDKLTELEKRRAQGEFAPRTVTVVRPQAPSPPTAPRTSKPGRNDPCWCGSGKKYKRCHLAVDQR
jgi:hypothetical protein